MRREYSLLCCRFILYSSTAWSFVSTCVRCQKYLFHVFKGRAHMVISPLSFFPSLPCRLQRPVPSTTAAATGRVKTQPRGCVAAALWDSPSSLMAKHAKVSKEKIVCEYTCVWLMWVERVSFTRFIWLFSEWSAAKLWPHHPLHFDLHKASFMVICSAAACYWFCSWAFLPFWQPSYDVNDGDPRRRCCSVCLNNPNTLL